MPSSRETGDETRVPWPVAVSFLIDPLGEKFTLPEVYALADPLKRAFPNNRHIEAKIRQSLQILRDRGQLAFAGAGRYEKLLPVPPRSVRLDFRVAAKFSSKSQIARVAVESWAARNVVCRRCESSLVLTPNNAVIARTPLRTTARRAGWVGSTIDLSGLTREVVVGPSFAPEVERWGP
jgi:hypothetical protein